MKRRIKENTKITLTFGQLKKILMESIDIDSIRKKREVAQNNRAKNLGKLWDYIDKNIERAAENGFDKWAFNYDGVVETLLGGDYKLCPTEDIIAHYKSLGFHVSEYQNKNNYTCIRINF